jgi:hypothetical protein
LKYAATIYCILFIVPHLVAQNRTRSLGPWHLTSLSGNIGLNGYYREQENSFGNSYDFSSNPFLMGNISLNTLNYVWHPNFLTIDINCQFNPGTEQQNFLISRDRAQMVTGSRLRLRGALFKTKPMSLVGDFNLSRVNTNREFVTSLLSKSKSWGLTYKFRNRVLPITIRYFDSDTDQVELETGRTFINHQKSLEGILKKSFTSLDDHEFRIGHNRYYRFQESVVATNLDILSMNLRNKVYFDSKKRVSWYSTITNLDQKGNINQQRLMFNERLNIQLPFSARFEGTYIYNKTKQELQSFQLNKIHLNLNHQLYSSLQTNVHYQYFNLNHSAYTQNELRQGISFNYKKGIPKGMLYLNFSYQRLVQEQESNSDFIRIIDERHILQDGEIVLLNNPFVQEATVVVKDEVGAIVYQLNLDYILIERDNFIEIQRVPGGQIPNGSLILVDYFADQAGSYRFDSNQKEFSIQLNLFKGLLDLYYAKSKQTFKSVEAAEFISLNPFDRDLIRGSLRFKFLTVNAEFVDYKALIVPFKQVRYSVKANGAISPRLHVDIYGNLIKRMLINTNTDQVFSDAHGSAKYRLGSKSHISLDFGYRKQIGEQIDLDLLTAKLEFQSTYNSYHFKVGADAYRRLYVGTELIIRGVYFELGRRF